MGTASVGALPFRRSRSGVASPSDGLGLVGTTLAGKYRVDAVHAAGGSGIVYRGHHLGFRRPIAIKCVRLPPHFGREARRRFAERFFEEAKLLFRLSEHRSIVRVFDCSVLDMAGQAIPYLVLEWLDGVSLGEFMQDRQLRGIPPLTELEALALLREPIKALAYAHHLRIAHHDVKPQNLFLVRTGAEPTVKLLDFGLAKLMCEAGNTTTHASPRGFLGFTPRYGAPEQFSPKCFGPTGPWTDVHAIGLVLTEMVTGVAAFDGGDDRDLHAQAIAEARATPRSRGAATSAGFDRLCATASARTPQRRYQTGSELLAVIDAHLSTRSTSAPRPSKAWCAVAVLVALAGGIAIVIATS